MKKKYKIMLGCLLLFILCAAGVLVYIQKTAPPSEEWISYQNDKLTASIDRQLEDLDIPQLMKDKENLILEKSIEELQQSVAGGLLTYEEITAVCLYRIRTLDQCEHGYNSVMEIAPDAISQARECDRRREELFSSGHSEPMPLLFGIPVMLKDNINTAGIPTSAGAVAFAEFIPSQDAPIVEALKSQGAVILGKNNLAEFAYYISSIMPNGYSGKKGQTVNPFGPLKISPSGSSSGSAVAVTANLVPVSIGTETAGSIVSPSAVNSVVGFKPTRDTVPGEGIFPLIRSIDTAGPIAKTVQDTAAAYAAISGEAQIPDLDSAALNGAVIGLSFYDYNNKDLVQSLKESLENAGALVVEVQIDQSSVIVQNAIVQTFKKDFEDYAGEYGLPVTKLEDLIEYNRTDPGRRAKYGQDLLEAANAVETPDPSRIEASVRSAQAILDFFFQDQGLDAIVCLNSTDSAIASAAGYPELTVPFGADGRSVPQGATFTAGYGRDWELLSLGYSFQETVGERIVPK